MQHSLPESCCTSPEVTLLNQSVPCHSKSLEFIELFVLWWCCHMKAGLFTSGFFELLALTHLYHVFQFAVGANNPVGASSKSITIGHYLLLSSYSSFEFSFQISFSSQKTPELLWFLETCLSCREHTQPVCCFAANPRPRPGKVSE